MQNDSSKFKKEFINRLIRFSIHTIDFSEKPRKEKISLSVIDQLIRSSTSIGANVVEAKSSSSKKDYIHYFEIALKSANETKYWFVIVREIAARLQAETNHLLKEVIEIANILASGVLTMKGKKGIILHFTLSF